MAKENKDKLKKRLKLKKDSRPSEKTLGKGFSLKKKTCLEINPRK